MVDNYLRNQTIFCKLWTPGKLLEINKQLAIFVYIVPNNHINRSVQHRFQHSG